MKKSAIIAAAIASLVAGTAAADATIYGAAHASIVSVDTKGATPVKNFQVQTNTSKLGFKGSEDLGNGMKAIWQMEMSYDLTDGAGIGGARNSFVGMSGDFGTAVIGRHDTPAKMAFYAAGNDHMGDTVVDLNGTFKFEEQRASNAIAYISPAFGAVTVAVAVVPGEGAGTATTAGDGLTDGTSFGVMYAADGIKLGLGIEDIADLIPGGADNSLMNLGGSYTMDNLTVGLQYQTQKDGTVDTTIYALVAAFKMDSNTFVASFGNRETDGATKTDSNVMNIGMNHALSKRASLTAGYTNTSDTAGGLTEGSQVAVGMNVKF
jgi:predicted porin